MLYSYYAVASCIILLCLAVPAIAGNLNTDFSKFPQWQRVMKEEVYQVAPKEFSGDLKAALDKLQAHYRRIPYRNWKELYPASTYWPTRAETKKLGAADCKGFSEAEYFDLLELGLLDADVEIAIALVADGSAESGEQHALVIVKDKWILDRRMDHVGTMVDFKRYYIPVAYFNRFGWRQ